MSHGTYIHIMIYRILNYKCEIYQSYCTLTFIDDVWFEVYFTFEELYKFKTTKIVTDYFFQTGMFTNSDQCICYAWKCGVILSTFWQEIKMTSLMSGIDRNIRHFLISISDSSPCLGLGCYRVVFLWPAHRYFLSTIPHLKILMMCLESNIWYIFYLWSYRRIYHGFILIVV